MIVSRSAGFHVSAQGQQAKLVRAVEEVFVGEVSWLGHHGEGDFAAAWRCPRIGRNF